LGYKNQVQAVRSQGSEEREALHVNAIKYFDYYIACLRNMNYSVSALTYYSKALSLYELGRITESDQALTSALEQDSRHRDSVYMKSRLLINQKNPEKALEILEEAVSYFNQDSDILFTLGILSNEMGNFQRLSCISDPSGIISKRRMGMLDIDLLS
jgi:tetratricopeptide (TPR) repeat protein